MHAAGHWAEPSVSPDNPKLYCLLRVRHLHTSERQIFLAKFVRGRWTFPDRSWLSNEWEVLRWAYVFDGD